MLWGKTLGNTEVQHFHFLVFISQKGSFGSLSDVIQIN